MDTKKATIRQLIIASLGAKAGLEYLINQMYLNCF